MLATSSALSSPTASQPSRLHNLPDAPLLNLVDYLAPAEDTFVKSQAIGSLRCLSKPWNERPELKKEQAPLLEALKERDNNDVFPKLNLYSPQYRTQFLTEVLERSDEVAMRGLGENLQFLTEADRDRLMEALASLDRAPTENAFENDLLPNTDIRAADFARAVLPQ